MNIKNKILTKELLYTVMLLFMTVWANSALAKSNPITATWDFKNGTYNEQTIQRKTASLTAYEMNPTDATPIEIFIDASKGKFAIQPTKKRVQFNEGTIVHIPVVSTNDIVKVTTTKPTDANRPSKFITIGGVEASEETTSYKAKSLDVEKGYVEIAAVGVEGSTTTNTYLYYISVTQYPPVYEEKCLYSTDFQDWQNITSSDTETEISKNKNGQEFKTIDGQPLSFYLKQTSVKNDGHNDNKPDWYDDTNRDFSVSDGWMMSNKKEDPYARISEIKNVTKIVYIQTSTGNDRGWGLKVKSKDDADWTIIYKAYINEIPTINNVTGNSNGQRVEITQDLNGNKMNLKDVQLMFYSRNPAQNAYMESLEIYGNVEVKENVNITYYDTDGTTELGKETVDASKPLTFIEGIESKITIPVGYKFRGWFDGTVESSEKVREGAELSLDLALYAKATPEEKATDGSNYTYNLTKSNFYQEDHELINIDGGVWHDVKHGWSFSKGGTITLSVAKKAHIDITLCSESKDGTITITDASGTEWASFNAKATADGDIQEVDYKGNTPTTLTISVPAGTYIHNINLRNYLPIYVSFDCEDNNIQGICPEKILCDPITGKATMPNHIQLSRDRFTFVGWTDGTNIYTSGSEYAFEQDVTLKPKMRKNTLGLYDTNSPIEVVWHFDYRKAHPISISNKSTNKILPYTKTIMVEGEEQDITLMMNASNGKIDNTDERINLLSNGAEGVQINNNTLFTIPAVYGMTITIHASDKVDDTSNNNETNFGSGATDAWIEISDDNGYIVPEELVKISDRKTITFTYKGDAEKAKIKILRSGSNNQWGFYKDFTVTYPVLPSIEFVKRISNPDLTTFPNENIENAGNASAELKNPEATLHTNTGKRYKEGDEVTISVSPKYGYKLSEFKVNGVVSTSQTLDHTIVAGKNTIIVTYEREKLYKVSVSSADIKKGSFTLTNSNDNFYTETRNKDNIITNAECWYTEGTEVTINGDASMNYMLDYWSDGTKKISETDPYIFNMGTENLTFIANFKLGYIGNVIFKIPEGMVNDANDSENGTYSITPSELKNVRSFTIPSNYTFYRSKSTMAYWVIENSNSENQNHYEPGQMYSFRNPDETLTLVPIFKDNLATADNRIDTTIVRYDFGRNIHSYYDPNLKQYRKVCAQPVNISHNEKPYWTAQARVNVLEEGTDKSHTRDFAILCDTGNDGYIRNTDLDNWCVFGPGTKLWVPAGNGTKITMLTYSKIVTTKFDGVVPTLDVERTNEERQKANSQNIFVYSYTTNSSENHVAIEIGDDYSYYQWLELQLPKANMVNLHTTVDDNIRGKIASIVSASGKYDTEELEDGGIAFKKGDRVRMTIKRKFGYELDKIVDPAKKDKNGNPLAVLEIIDDNTVKMVGLNNVSTTSIVTKNEDGSWGVATGDKKTVFVLRKIEPTEEGIKKGNRTSYIIEFDITTHRNLEVCFKEKPTYHITYNPGLLASGTAPEAAWVEKGDKYTIPTNKTLYYEGNTLDHWVDENDNIFTIGTEYTAEGKDRRLFPIFKANAFNFFNLETEATATWYLNKDEGAPTINYEKTKGILVTQLTNSKGERIDLKVDLDASGGKFNNTDSARTERIQINSNSAIEFPSTPNCEVTWVATSDFEKIKIADNIVKTVPEQKRQVTAVCAGKSAYEKIEFIDGIYSRCFSITYKPQDIATKPTIESLTCDGITYNATEIQEQMNTQKHITFHVSPWKLKDQIPAVTGIATNGGKVVATKATIETKECVATVRTASDVITETFPIVFEFNIPEEGNNPKFKKININGVDYTQTTNEILDAAQSGAIKITFSRTMKDATITSTENNITCTAKSDSILVFKYWDAPRGGTVTFEITPKSNTFTDIYTKTCQEPIFIKLHIMDDADYYHHHRFDFVVGKDGNIDEAIEAANNNTKTDGHRYYIFVPDGEYKLTGNGTISFGGDSPVDENGKPRPDMNGKNNGQTHIRKPNISIIGQSKDNTIIRNHPTVEGISYTATIYVEKNNTDFYAEDLTLENEFNYWGSISGQSSSIGAGRADAFYDRGDRSIMKNVALKSYQDTYFSNNASPDYRGYFEKCDFYGVVDFICGNGNIWFDKCNLILRDRRGNNIAAPSTEVSQEWGYVFNNCTIKPESDNMIRFTDKDWTLARAWSKSPACTYLNTKMYAQPISYGWGRSMESNLMLRFHEYKSTDDANNMLSLVTRTLAACVPAAGSDDVILSDDKASEYNLRNVVGGTDGFEPKKLCKQIDAASGAKVDQDENHEVWDDNIVLDDENLVWNYHISALCYVVFKLNETTNKWEYIDNTTDTFMNLTAYGSGYYSVRAANQRGGLGAATKAIRYVLRNPYKLEIKKVGNYKEGDEDYGWTTICLPFNAKVPNEVNVYAATAHNKQTATDKVEDFTMTLTPVEIIDSLKGYVVYGAVGDHYFIPTSRTCDKPTILTGNPTNAAISSTNINCYVLAYKTWGLGFYKYTGTTLAANRGWLPQDMVSKSTQDGLALGKRGISFVISDPTTGFTHPVYTIQSHNEAYYNLNGQRIKTPTQPGIYISRRKGKVIK